MSTAYEQAVEYAMRDAKIPRRSSLKKPRPRGCKPKKRSVDFSPEVTMSSCSETSSIQLDDEVFFNPMPTPNSLKSAQQQSASRTMDVFSVSAKTQVPQPSNTRDWAPSGAYTNPAFDTNSEAKAYPISLQSPRSPREQQQSKYAIGATRPNEIGQPVLQRNQQAVVVLPNGADMPTHFNHLSSKNSSVCSSKAGCWFAVGGIVLLISVVVIVFVVVSQVGLKR